MQVVSVSPSTFAETLQHVHQHMNTTAWRSLRNRTILNGCTPVRDFTSPFSE